MRNLDYTEQRKTRATSCRRRYRDICKKFEQRRIKATSCRKRCRDICKDRLNAVLCRRRCSDICKNRLNAIACRRRCRDICKEVTILLTDENPISSITGKQILKLFWINLQK
jgi:hypothetical protein